MPEGMGDNLYRKGETLTRRPPLSTRSGAENTLTGSRLCSCFFSDHFFSGWLLGKDLADLEALGEDDGKL